MNITAILLVIAGCVSSMSAAEAVDPFGGDRARWLADVGQPAWWMTIGQGDPSPIMLPPGNPTVPAPAIQGCFHRSEFSAFLAYPLLNHRNAIRLLGKPTSAKANRDTVTLEWARPVLVDAAPAADPNLSLTIRTSGVRVTIFDHGTRFRWQLIDLASGNPLDDIQ